MAAERRDSSFEYGRLLAKQAELEKRVVTLHHALVETSEEIERLRKAVVKTDTEVRAVQTAISGVERLLEPLRSIKTIRGVLVALVIATATAIPGYLLTEGERRAVAHQTRDDVGALKDWRDRASREGTHISATLISLDTQLREWRTATERRISGHERVLEQIEQRLRLRRR